MEKKLKYGIIGGVSLIALGFSVYYLRNALNKRRANRPCKGKRCVKKLIGKTLDMAGTEVNIRETPEVENGYFLNNKIGTVRSNPVGVITNQLDGIDGYIWFEIKLNNPIDGKSKGFVREDVVVIKK